MGYTAAVRPAWENPNHPSPVKHPPQTLTVLDVTSTALGTTLCFPFTAAACKPRPEVPV